MAKHNFRFISEGEPQRYVISVLSVKDVCISTEKFFDDNFRGAIELHPSESNDGHVMASAEGIAYFFKYLLNAIFSKSKIDLEMNCDSELLTMSTRWKRLRELSVEDIRTLERVARASGFGFEIKDDGDYSKIDLFLSIQALNYIPIYAKDAYNMHKAYIEVFFLI
jgi:hypothetical protein